MKGGPVWGDPKSHQRRVVYLPASIAALLQAHLDERVPEDPEALVFTSNDGTILNPSNFRTRVWLKALAAAGLPRGFRFHDLRHTCASMMARAGVPLHEVKDQMGHSSLMVTERYLHFYPRGGGVIGSSLMDYLAKDMFGPAVFGLGLASDSEEVSSRGTENRP